MKSYDNIRLDREQFLSLTSLYPEEFDLILPDFASCWYKFYRTRTLEGKRRKIKNLYPQKNTPTLPRVEDKLFFLLVYLKLHPLQEFQACVFDLSQAKVSIWVKLLRPFLADALRKLECLPCRNGEVLKAFILEIDANVEIKVDCLDNQYVVFLSATYLGSVHDKKIADEEACQYPKGIRLRQDLGFQGYEPEGVYAIMPFKKPRKGTLCWIKRWFNQYVGQRRIVIEHAIRGIKRCHIVQHPCRLMGYWVRDQLMDICTGLHNLRVRSPLRAYKSDRKFQLDSRTCA